MQLLTYLITLMGLTEIWADMNFQSLVSSVKDDFEILEDDEITK